MFIDRDFAKQSRSYKWLLGNGSLIRSALSQCCWAYLLFPSIVIITEIVYIKNWEWWSAQYAMLRHYLQLSTYTKHWENASLEWVFCRICNIVISLGNMTFIAVLDLKSIFSLVCYLKRISYQFDENLNYFFFLFCFQIHMNK